MGKSIDENIDDSGDLTHHSFVEFDWDDGVRDDRKDYGERRYNMLARLDGRVLHITFTPRGPVTWLISARKANGREQKRYEHRT